METVWWEWWRLIPRLAKTNHHGFSLDLCFGSLALRGSQLPCCEGTETIVGIIHVARSWGLLTTARNEGFLQEPPSKPLWKQILQHPLNLEVTAAPANILIAASWDRFWDGSPSAATPEFLILRNCDLEKYLFQTIKFLDTLLHSSRELKQCNQFSSYFWPRLWHVEVPRPGIKLCHCSDSSHSRATTLNPKLAAPQGNCSTWPISFCL